ncbi:MAG TPA: BMP family ABC transporter substrate-binding protein [Streptosporangiaceae bacterium]|nr:BMP family ABC transporter substrate-binding protein [Streptosporangiaceae bacterium]
MRGSLKIVAALSVLAVATAACGSSSGSSSPGGSGGSGSSSSAAAAPFKACMVTDTGGIDDKSFNQSSYQGLQDAKTADPNIAITYLPSTTTADYASNISTFIAQKCGIIVTVGFLMAAATEAAAKANPTQKFAIVDCSYASHCLNGAVEPNIDQLVFNTVQDGFLGGYLAAAVSKTHVVATYGGENFGTVTIYEDGFWDGVQYFNKQHHASVKVLGWNETTQKGNFIGNFTDLGAGQNLTNTFIGDNADVIFPVAGGVGLGTAKAVQTADAGGKHVSIEWVDTDGCTNAPQYCGLFLTSVTKGIVAAVKTAVLSAANGSFKGGTYVGTLANGGAVLSPYHDFAKKIPASVQAEIKSLTSQVESGKIVPATKSPV